MTKRTWRSLSVTLLLALAGCASAPAGSATVDVGPVSAAPMQLVSMDGTALDLEADLASGRPVALVFWTTWCGSCKAEAPELNRGVALHGEAIRFVGVVPGPEGSVDDAEVQRVAREWGLEHPQVRDRDLALTKAYGVQGTPTLVVLGTGGRVLYRGHELPKSWGAFLR